VHEQQFCAAALRFLGGPHQCVVAAGRAVDAHRDAAELRVATVGAVHHHHRAVRAVGDDGGHRTEHFGESTGMRRRADDDDVVGMGGADERVRRCAEHGVAGDLDVEPERAHQVDGALVHRLLLGDDGIHRRAGGTAAADEPGLHRHGQFGTGHHMQRGTAPSGFMSRPTQCLHRTFGAVDAHEEARGTSGHPIIAPR